MLSVLEDTVLTRQCHHVSHRPHQNLLPGAVPVLHHKVLLTRMGQIPAKWVEPGKGKAERAQLEEGEGVRKSYGGYGGEGAGAWHLPIPGDSYREAEVSSALTRARAAEQRSPRRRGGLSGSLVGKGAFWGQEEEAPHG